MSALAEQLGLAIPEPRACRECGCTDTRACVLVIGGEQRGRCQWLEYDLCSACTPKAQNREDGVWVAPRDQPAVPVFDPVRQP